jgi:tetratricopeptide (TPR) repeat protein
MCTLRLILLISILQVSNCYVFSQRKLDSMMKVFDSLEKTPPSYGADTAKVLVLNEISRYLVNFRIDFDKGMEYAEQAHSIAEKHRWRRGIVESYYSKAKVYLLKEKDTQAINIYRKAIAVSREKKMNKWEATLIQYIGEIYLNQDNYPMALEHFLNSLRINEEVEEVEPRNHFIGRNLTQIGQVHHRMEDFKTALKYGKQALERFEKEKDKVWMSITLQGIAGAYVNEKEYDSALHYFAKVIELLKGNPYSTYMTYIDMGDCYRHQLVYGLAKQPDSAWKKAMDFYSKAYRTAVNLKDTGTVGVALNGIGWLHLKNRDFKNADTALSKASSFISQSTPLNIKDYYLNMSFLDSAKRNWKSSLAYYKLYTAIEDSLFDKKKSRQMTQLQIKYETDKKQEEIAILNKDNELKALRIEQQQKNILLIIAATVIFLLGGGGFIYYRNKKIKQQALKQISEAKLSSLKSLMDKHFIFSSLHSIDTFLMNNNSEAASDYLVKYSKLIRSILEMSNQAEVSLEEEITLCKSYLDLEKIRLENSFDYDFSIDGTISMQETLFPSMLLQPLVENAVKHGVGSINVDIKREKDKLICNVTDNGKGLQFSGNTSNSHRSYSGKGIIERVRVYNTLRKNKASFLLKDNNPGVTAVLTLPYILQKQSVAV